MSTLGYHPAAWRHPRSPVNGNMRLDFYTNVARIAEAGKFDMVFLADGLAMNTDDVPAGSRERISVLQADALTVLPALAAVTHRIGLVATASTTYNEPYHVARKFATLDQLSSGRSGWNVVTSCTDRQAQNFGGTKSAGPEFRYDRAREFLDVVFGLWDSWEDGAILSDKAGGRYYDPAKLRTLDHRGRHFSVRGPLNVAPSPQGYPVIVTAGTSDAGLELAAAKADVVYCVNRTREQAQEFYRSIKERMHKYDRKPEELKILPGLLAVVAETEREAQRKFSELDSMIDPLVGLSVLCRHMGDLTPYPLDGPVPALDYEVRGRGRYLYEMARSNNLTIRQLYQQAAAGHGHRVVVGTAEQIADAMEDWIDHGAADGYNIVPFYLPGSIEDFVSMVVPELQRREVFRRDYEGSTLREHLGLRASAHQKLT
ncbi:LLM class flavin-dependent oxidoreductase (plasmid) [Nitrobacteraceae bacterium UC4446_H13]